MTEIQAYVEVGKSVEDAIHKSCNENASYLDIETDKAYELPMIRHKKLRIVFSQKST